MASACTVGGFFKVTSPFGLLITRPAEASSPARRGRTRNVTSRPASSMRPPKYPPIAPAPTTSVRIRRDPTAQRSSERLRTSAGSVVRSYVAGRDRLFDVAQSVLAEVDLLADEKGGRAEGAAFDRALV